MGVPEIQGEKQQTQSVRRGQQQSRLQPVWRVPARRRCRMSRAAAPCTPQHARFCGHPKSEHGKGEVGEVKQHTGPEHGRRRTGWMLWGPALSASDCRTGTAAQGRSQRSFAQVKGTKREDKKKKKKLCRAVRIVSFVRKREERGKKQGRNGFRRRRRRGTQPWARGPPTPWQRGR